MPFGSGKPTLQFPALLSGRLLQDSALDLRDGERRNEQIRIGLFSQPSNQGWRRYGLRDIADDVCIEQVPAHRSTLRPDIGGRLRSRSAPTRGERRSALRIPPFGDGSPETVWRIAARIRAESESSPASLRASVRISSRSAPRPRTSEWVSNHYQTRATHEGPCHNLDRRVETASFFPHRITR